MAGSLTPLESRLVKAVEDGVELDVAGAGPVDEAAMRSWTGPTRTIRAEVVRDIVTGRLVERPDPRGLRLRGVRVTGRIDLENVSRDLEIRLNHCYLPDGLLLNDATLISVSLDNSWIGDGIEAGRLETRLLSLIGATVTGAILLSGGRVGGVQCDDARLSTTSGLVLNGNGLRADQGLFLRNSTITSADEAASIYLMGAHLANLDADGARLSNSAGPVLNANELRVEHGLFLRGCEATGAGELATIHLLGAHLGSLECDNTQLANTNGPALNANVLRVEQSVFLRHGFAATGVGPLGAVRLASAHFRRLECDGATLSNDAGPAVDADLLRVDEAFFLRDCTLTNTGLTGTLRLVDAHLGVLDCNGAQLQNTAGPAIDAHGLRVDQGVWMGGGFTATGAAEHGTIQVPYATIGGHLWLDTSTIGSSSGGALIDLDGTTYIGLPRPGRLSDWLRLLRRTPAYAAQPYQQLAAVHRAAGHDREVRTILMAQRQAQIDRRAITGWDRFWTRLTGWTLGFGYQTWRALVVLLGVLILSVVAALWAGSEGGLAHTSRTPSVGTPCSTLEQIGVGLDLGTPLLKTGARETCAPTTAPAGQALAVAGWFLQALAWAFAALFIAGFTGAVRKT
ncbi:hypothetical protein AB0M02_23315 [Actinoplanes sp. NPDC051861]|uniref:hypothetical protein n=1 Tax=Actinoplanes sp. NPDC051861 TaxID=3155170 RepID=UPI003430C831